MFTRSLKKMTSKLILIIFLPISIGQADESNIQQSTNNLYRGIEFLQQNKLDEALKSFNKSIELNPSNPIAYGNKGNVHELKKEYTLALNNYNKAIDLGNL